MDLSSVFETFSRERRLSHAQIEELGELDTSSALVVGDIIESLRPSANALMKILELGKDVATRDGKNLSEVLKHSSVVSLLEDDRRPRKQRLAELRSALESQRYPQTLAVREKLNSLSQDVRSKFNLALDVPKDLEGDSVTISVKIRSSKELDDVIANLEALKIDGTLEEVFSTLLGEVP